MYYPLSQITSNLYTNGNEFIYLNNKSPYVGHYWKTSTGKYYTGKTPQDLPTEEIILSNISLTEITIDPISDNPSFYNRDDLSPVEYINLTNPPPPSLLPIYSPNIPTQTDYQIGEYRRYFCKKTNEIIYLEISKDTYDKLVNKDSKILYQLYQPFNLPWQLTGDKSQVFITNKNITELTSQQQKLPMLSEYLRNDFTKYYK
jgi:sensor histidine kinase YesM